MLAAETETAENQATTRRIWVHEINAQRKEKEKYHMLVQELRLDNDRHSQYFRMNKQSFDHLLSLLAPSITKQDTRLRGFIEPGLKLAVILQHLAEGCVVLIAGCTIPKTKSELFNKHQTEMNEYEPQGVELIN